MKALIALLVLSVLLCSCGGGGGGGGGENSSRTDDPIVQTPKPETEDYSATIQLLQDFWNELIVSSEWSQKVKSNEGKLNRAVNFGMIWEKSYKKLSEEDAEKVLQHFNQSLESSLTPDFETLAKGLKRIEK